jgi:hypothetical protein
MRFSSSVTSVSWIPSEAVKGISKPIFELGVTHYDEPLPDRLDDLDAWRETDRFRFANRLAGWVEVEDGRIVDAGYADGTDGGLASGGVMGATTVRVGVGEATFAAVGLDDIRRDVEISAGSARFVQTAGGRTAVPAPRHVNRPPFVHLQSPVVWTTMSLTIDADGNATYEVAGASPFPRHWIFDDAGALVAKVGLADFKTWYHGQNGRNTPWGDEDTPALVTAVETALERELSHQIMRAGTKPKLRKVKEGKTLTEQGAEGDELYLLLDGVLAVEVDGEPLAELGPGAIVGERAVLEGGRRTCTLRALTPVRVAVASADQIDPAAMGEVSTGHRREEARQQ